MADDRRDMGVVLDALSKLGAFVALGDDPREIEVHEGAEAIPEDLKRAMRNNLADLLAMIVLRQTAITMVSRRIAAELIVARVDEETLRMGVARALEKASIDLGVAPPVNATIDRLIQDAHAEIGGRR